MQSETQKLIDDGYQPLHVNNNRSAIIVNALNMAAGLDYAIASIKEGHITKACSEHIRQLIAQTLNIFCYPIAFDILSDNDCVKNKAATVGDFIYRFDLPDDSHDDLVIYYKDKPILDS